MKQIILSILLCLLLCDVALATDDAGAATPGELCSKDCDNGGSNRNCMKDCTTVEDLRNLPPQQIQCEIDQRLAQMGFGNAVIGWGRSCTIPAGEQSPSPYSCISTGNVMGQLIDTLLTFGIASDMRRNFCSFAPGTFPSKIEGAIIQRSILEKNCAGLVGQTAQNCTSCILKGKLPNSSGIGCQYDPKNPDPLKLDEHISNSDNPSVHVCNGIPNLEQPLLDEKNNPIYKNDRPIYCPITRCNIPTNHIMNKYYDHEPRRTKLVAKLPWALWLIPISFFSPTCCDIERLEPNQSKRVALMGFVQIRSRIQGDMICTQMNFGFSGWTTLACKARIPPEIDVPDNACFVNNIIGRNGYLKSKWIFPITSQVVQMISDVFDAMFKGMPNCQNGLTEFQNNMKTIVRTMLFLYVIVLGFKMMISNGMIEKKEIFMFILKFGLVIYFSVGTFNSTTTTYNNGLIWLRQSLTTATTSLSNMVVKATNPKICNFSNISYDKGYEYLRMWDTLDCKLAFYLGLTSPTDVGYNAHKSGVSQLFTGIFSLLWGLIITGNFLVVTFLFAFGIFLLSLVVYFTHIYIISMVAITIMIFFGPIFVPMALFDQTKSYFDSWLKSLLGYSLQPVVVVAVISMMISTFDLIIYSDCNFIIKDIAPGKPYWVFNSDNQSDICRATLGHFSANFSIGKKLGYAESKTADGDKKESLFKYTVTTNKLTKDLLDGLMLSTFFAFLFYYFSGQIGALASELTNAPSAATNPIGSTAVFDTLAAAYWSKPKKVLPKKAKAQGSDKAEEGVEISGEKNTETAEGKAGEADGSDGGSKSKESNASETKPRTASS